MCEHIYERDKERTNTNTAARIAQVNLAKSKFIWSLGQEIFVLG